MRKFIRFFKSLPSSIRLLRDPDRLDAVITLAECVTDPVTLDKFVEIFEKDPQGKIAFQKKPRVGKLDWKKFSQFPEDTLGYKYFQFLSQNKLDPSSLPTLPSDKPWQYVMAYYYETHDLYHVLMGFNTRPAGELGVQAFYVAQMPSRHAILILGLSFFQTLFSRIGELDERCRAIVRGWLLGKSSQLLFAIDWSPYWNESLETVRARFNIRVHEIDSWMPRGHEHYFTSAENSLPTRELNLKIVADKI